MTRTAVGAATPPPFDDLLAAIDAMDGPTLRAFLGALRDRYNLAAPSYPLTITPSVTLPDFTVTTATRTVPTFIRPENIS